MKSLIRVGLALALILTPSTLGVHAQDKAKSAPVEYDAGTCAPDQYLAVHFQLTDETFVVTALSEGPDQVQELKADELTTYHFTKVDGDGRHYISALDPKAVYEVVIKKHDKAFEGYLTLNEEKIAIFYGDQADGKDFLTSAVAYFKTCLKMLHKVAADDPSV